MYLSVKTKAPFPGRNEWGQKRHNAPGAGSLGGGVKSKHFRKYFLQNSTFTPERPYVPTSGAKHVYCPGAI